MKAHTNASLSVFAILLLASGCADTINHCPSACLTENGTCCNQDQQCINNQCIAVPLNYSCTTSDDCPGNMACISGSCLCQTADGRISAVCSASETCCETGCINPNTSHDNCGQCGNTCAPSVACVAGKCDPDTCENGTKQCNASNDGIDICRNGHWTATDSFCIGNQVCRNSRCEAESCTNDSMRCHNGNVEKCIGQDFTIYSQCISPQVCDDDTFECVTPPECINGEMQCNELGNINKCLDQHWVQIELCPAGTVCHAGTHQCEATAECLTGDSQCSGSDRKFCNNGHWETSPCPAGQSCSSGSCISSSSVCSEGSAECRNDPETGFDQIVRCENGSFTVQKTCESNQVCQKNGTSIQCSNKCDKTIECNSNILYTCVNGNYEKSAECTGDEYCDEILGKCSKKCGNGVVDPGEECDGNNLNGQTCSTAVAPDYAGTLSCSESCTLIHSACTKTETTQPVTENSSYLITFDEDAYTFPVSSSYEPGSPLSFDYNNVHWEISGKTDVIKYADNLISGNGVAFNGSKSDQYMEASSISSCINSISFQYRIWSTKDTNGTLKVTLTTTGGSETTLSFDYKKTDSPLLHNETISAGSTAVSTIRFEPGTHTTSNSRVIIDNISWTACK